MIQSNSFGVFSHSKGFGAELLSDSLWLSGADPSWAAKTFRGKFHQGSAKVSPRFHQASPSFVVSLVLWGRFVLGLPRGSSWAAKRFCGRFLEVPPRFRQGCASFVIALVCHHFFTFVSQFSTFFCIFLKRVSFEVFSRSQGLGAK